MERWSGRVAIVTGAGAGIGAGVARLLAENGVKVVGVARRVERVQELAQQVTRGEIHALQGDVTKEEDVVRIVKWTRENLGGADVLVNNAGIFHATPLTDIDTDKLRHLLDLNVFGLCLCTTEVIKDMRDRGVDDGHIFHISSVTAHNIFDIPGVYPASATKHAVKVLTEGLRRELRDLKTKIRVTEISPGLVRTEGLEAAGMSKDEAEKVFASRQCLLEPRDVAEALLYALASPPHVQVHEITMYPTGEDLL